LAPIEANLALIEANLALIEANLALIEANRSGAANRHPPMKKLILS
jgi:hypothetical protein